MRLGTRGSALALAQAEHVAGLLEGEVEIVTVTTSGDRGAAVGDKSRWVDTIESALLSGEIDVAVHSAKDVPGELADGTTLVGTAGREDPRDALVGASALDELPEGARVGTSSLRRRAQLLAARPDLEICELRGNVDTRLRKLAAGEADAIVLAAAGLQRLGRGDEIGGLLDPVSFVPAPGQGTLVLQARDGTDLGLTVDDALAAERAVCQALGATCHTPIGVHATDGVLRAWVGRADGGTWIRDEVGGSGDLAALLVSRLETMGARELLEG